METFIVRIWSGGGDGEPMEGIRGVVRHVASGRERSFAGFEDLRLFLGIAEPAGTTDEARRPTRQRKAQLP